MMDDLVCRWELGMAEQFRISMLQHREWKSLSAPSNRRRLPESFMHAEHPMPGRGDILERLHILTRRLSDDPRLSAELELIYTTPATLRDKLCAVTIAGRSHLRRVQAERLARHASKPLVRSLRRAVLWELRHGELVSLLRPT